MMSRDVNTDTTDSVDVDTGSSSDDTGGASLEANNNATNSDEEGTSNGGGAEEDGEEGTDNAATAANEECATADEQQLPRDQYRELSLEDKALGKSRQLEMQGAAKRRRTGHIQWR
jgi:hypothetical protein